MNLSFSHSVRFPQKDCSMLTCWVLNVGIVFLDHLLRHGPQTRFYEHKRSYFFENIQDMGPELARIAHKFHFQLPQSATVYRGAFQTIRACPVKISDDECTWC